MVVAEYVGEAVGRRGMRLEHGGPRVSQQPLVIPEVLDALAPLVQALDRRVPAHNGRVGRPAAVMGAHGAGVQRVLAAAIDRPFADPRRGRLQRVDDVIGGRSPALSVRSIGLLGQPVAQLAKRPFGQAPDEALGEPVKRLEHDVGIACVGDQAGGVAQKAVLTAIGGLRHVRPGQAQDRPRLLQVLASAMDGLHGVLAALLAQHARRGLELPDGGAAQHVRDGLIEAQPVAQRKPSSSETVVRIAARARMAANLRHFASRRRPRAERG
ncbi:MAG: hypothetical protein M3P44_07065, partial [Actinomycetota bacterium]|nr:hypothetical protein [Actinomycetota bacterium]